MKRKNRILIDLAVILVLILGVTLYCLHRPGYPILYKISDTPLNRMVKYTWNVGTPDKKDIKAVCKFDNNDFILSCSGTGAMMDFDRVNRVDAWNILNNITTGWAVNIDRVYVNEGITSIGTNEFKWFIETKEVYLPSTLISIKEGAMDFGYDTKVYYNSTVEDWNRIDLDEEWQRGNWITQINCTDGIVEIPRKIY
ncbi:MAG: hypothetical protein Q4F95_08200 [Oscillospiraceae bacterium]|nr:hypothetical protein [Oscillospiraceae bacterium]